MFKLTVHFKHEMIGIWQRFQRNFELSGTSNEPCSNQPYPTCSSQSTLPNCLQLNKFEQVCSDGHQMSVAVGDPETGGSPMPDIWGPLYNEAQCIIGNGHMGTNRHE